MALSSFKEGTGHNHVVSGQLTWQFNDEGSQLEFDIVIKIATFVLGAAGAAKLFYDISIGRRSRLREEYKFAKDFLEDLKANLNMHPFVRDKGYQAIAGDDHLETEEIEYLLSLQRPDRALRDYVLGRPYLKHLPHVGNLQITFREKYSAPWARTWRKFMHAGLYFVFVFLAIAPLLLSKFLFKSLSDILLASAGCLVIFGPYAWSSLKAAARIHRAEKLVQHQNKHTQRILLSNSAR
jgi:hypothetical protein